MTETDLLQLRLRLGLTPSISQRRRGTDSARRDRQKKDGRSSEDKRRSYWLGEVFVDQGWAWATELVQIEPLDDGKRWQALPLCLGREADIIPILEGQGAVPQEMHPRRRQVLLEVREYIANHNARSDTRNDRTKRFSFRKRAGRGFRGNYRYGLRVEG